MKLYVCWTTVQTPRPGGHPCHNAHEALRLAGYHPEVIKVRGLGMGPRFVHWMTDGRREVEWLTGQRAVPVLVTDDGEVVADSKRIIEWAEANPEHRARTGSASGSSAGGISGQTGSASGSSGGGISGQAGSASGSSAGTTSGS